MTNRLFSESPDWYDGILIRNGDNVHNKWNAYAYGYLEAANTLKRKVLFENGNLGQLIFPIVFLYRHYIELRLKEIVEHGSNLIDVPYKLPTHHDLMTIWTDAKKIIVQIWPQTSNSSLSKIDSVLTDFINIDRKSDAFRYPIDTKGLPTLNGVSNFSLRNFLEVLQPVLDDLEGMTLGIGTFEDYKDEMRAAYSSYLGQ